MADIILHHYDASPFAHKVRLMMGHKGLAWKSVVIPMVMPKPDLMPLTGGYRRTPVMQIGADIYCDTRRMGWELENRHPEPGFYPAGGDGLAAIMTRWADDILFLPGVNFVFSNVADKLPPTLLADRAKMRGNEPPDPAQLKALTPRLHAVVTPMLATVESLFSDGRAYVSGDKPGLADYALYHPLWMFTGAGKSVAAALEPYPSMTGWMDRVAAVGEGAREEMDSGDALAIARDSEPAPLPGAPMPDAASPQPGDNVAVLAADKVPEAVEGEVVYVDGRSVTIRRQDAQVGALHQHFPREGYTFTKI
jgi:glutathione S-transferase